MNVQKKCICFICQNNFAYNKVTPVSLIRESIMDVIKESNENISNEDYICLDDLKIFRKKYFEKMVQDEKGDLDEINASVMVALQERETISSNINEEDNIERTFGEKVSDKMATFGGSWRFLILFMVAMSIWITWNAFSSKIFDPYPFILLNLFLSCLAAVQAPIIMMSQNRQSSLDRRHQEEDYKVNLKLEIDIRMLNEKMDKLISHQWQRMIKIQELQMEMMEELTKDKK